MRIRQCRIMAVRQRSQRRSVSSTQSGMCSPSPASPQRSVTASANCFHDQQASTVMLSGMAYSLAARHVGSTTPWLMRLRQPCIAHTNH